MTQVTPTGSSPNDQYSDGAIANVFNAHVNSLNVEKQLIWQRYQAMLVANAIAFSFAATNLKQEALAVLFISVFGFVLCIIWAMLNHAGWRVMWHRIDYTREFVWSGYQNPQDLPHHSNIRAGIRTDHVYVYATSVVVLFGCAYVGLAIWSAIRLCQSGAWS